MRPLKTIYLLSIGNMILTVIHHIYGAIIYDNPFRIHVVFFAIPVIVFLIFAYRLFHSYPTLWYGKLSFWLLFLVMLLVPVGIIGFYEGGYNHLLKNILFFGGTSQARLDALFPAPTYEMPNDFLFEFTGILQFFPAVYSVYYLIKNGFKTS